MRSDVPGRARHAIEAEALGKCFRRRGGAHWAVADVSFRLGAGRALGLVGANGAGKSTLLRVLSGATPATSGRYRCAGRIASLLELGAGFHPDFTGRENLLMNGVLLGASRREVRARTGAILEFAELEDVADEPLRTYSSGMAMRLGFAAALGVEPAGMLLDEVFAVGDLAFQKKCVDRLLDFRARGGCVVLASHSLYDIRQLCDEVLWLKDGRVARMGEAAAVTNDYAAWQGERVAARSASAGGSGGHGSARIACIAALGADGAPASELESGADLRVLVWWENPDPDEALQLGLTLTRHDGTLAAGLGTHLAEGAADLTLRGRAGCVALDLPRLALLAGSFTLTAYLFDVHGLHRWHERVLESPIVVKNDTREVGLVRLEHRFSHTDAERPRTDGGCAA